METRSIDAKEYGLSDLDISIIDGIISECNSLKECYEMAKAIFKNRITVNHYLVIGYLIGQSIATEKARYTNKLNFSTLWQRLN